MYRIRFCLIMHNYRHVCKLFTIILLAAKLGSNYL